MRPVTLNRRQWLAWTGFGWIAASSSPWLAGLSRLIAAHPNRRRQCILLWMSGGPSQTDTFDMKVGHANGGEFKEIATRVPGMWFSQHLPGLAHQAEHLAIVRSLSTREGDHGRATFLVRTGRSPGDQVAYPAIGCALSKELDDTRTDLPPYVTINPSPEVNPDAFGPGFLGPQHAPATVGEVNREDPEAASQDNGFADLRVQNLALPEGVSLQQAERRQLMWQLLQRQFAEHYNSSSTIAHDTVYRRAWQLMASPHLKAFDLSEEPPALREAYGRGAFGQGCLIARRLVEHTVPVVEVTLGNGLGWDTHRNNFETVRRLSAELDAGWSTLIQDLEQRGLLDQTTILWMGEFGRTPRINDMAGRDHYPAAWSCVFAGGGIAGGQVYGSTSKDGMEVTDGKVGIGDVLATLCTALGIDPEQENISPIGRPFRIAEGTPIRRILT